MCTARAKTLQYDPTSWEAHPNPLGVCGPLLNNSNFASCWCLLHPHGGFWKGLLLELRRQQCLVRGKRSTGFISHCCWQTKLASASGTLTWPSWVFIGTHHHTQLTSLRSKNKYTHPLWVGTISIHHWGWPRVLPWVNIFILSTMVATLQKIQLEAPWTIYTPFPSDQNDVYIYKANRSDVFMELPFLLL